MFADLISDTAILQVAASLEKQAEETHNRAIDTASFLGLTEAETMLRELINMPEHISWIKDAVELVD